MIPCMPGTPIAKTIAEMATTYKVSLRTLRFYEDLELLKPLRIGVARLYPPREEIKLQLILKGKRLGFSLAEIRRLMLARKQDEPAGAPPSDLELPPELISAQIVVLEKRRTAVAAAIDELKLALTG